MVIVGVLQINITTPRNCVLNDTRAGGPVTALWSRAMLSTTRSFSPRPFALNFYCVIGTSPDRVGKIPWEQGRDVGSGHVPRSHCIGSREKIFLPDRIGQF